MKIKNGKRKGFYCLPFSNHLHQSFDVPEGKTLLQVWSFPINELQRFGNFSKDKTSPERVRQQLTVPVSAKQIMELEVLLDRVRTWIGGLLEKL